MEQQYEKQEKQRQNEEISGNMTESWEVVIVKPNESGNAVNNSSSKPCFIDASTLLDDHEVGFDGPFLPQSGCFTLKPIGEQEALKDDNFCDELMIFQCDDQQAASSSTCLSLQQEMERRKGKKIFDCTINQFSGHKINLNEESDVTPNYFDKIRTTDAEDSIGLCTPFNSIVQFDYIRHCPVSLQETIDINSDKIDASRIDLLSRKSYDESIPIISGGSSIEDHFTRPNTSSPSVKRKTENCPIVSGGSTISLAENESSSKSRLSSSSSSNTSWTINFHKNEATVKPKVYVPCSAPAENAKSNCGFLVDMAVNKQSDVKIIDKSVATKVIATNDSLRKSTGFFIDFSSDKQGPTLPENNQQINEVIEPQDKKNIFSMFVDISDEPRKKKKPSLEATAVTDKNTKETNEARDSVVKLRNAEMSALHRNFELAAKQRHSWNETERFDEKNIYKRSVSVSSEIIEPASSNLASKLLSSKSSSMNIDSSIPSPLEDFSSKSLSSNYSNNSVTNSNSSNCASELIDRQRRHRKDVKINETFDKSSAGSITDGILSLQDSSSSPISTTTEEVTCCPENMDNDNLAQTSGSNSLKASKKGDSFIQRSINQTEALKEQQDITKEAMATLQKTIEKQKQLLETVNENIDESQNKAFYVKLSDMDKPILDPTDQSTFISDIFSNSMSSALRSGRNRGSSAGGSNSKHRQSWTMMTCSTGNGQNPASVNNLALSFENSKSLSRLFPHLSKAFSNSVPTNMELTSAINLATTNNSIAFNSQFINQSNVMCDCDFSCDFSCTSSTSCASSHSNIDSADDSSIGNRQRLGEDLLKMFLQEIATDVAIEVGGKKMRAHKCILRSRCQYFAAILAGHWLNNSGNIISLPVEYSFATVHFALCHIYSGASHPPEGISLMELASLSDLLGLEGLKEVTAYSLKINYCHNFHKPCSGCIDGICLVLPTALNHGLDELYRKCLRWVCKYYIKVWSTRAFSQLPKELINRCRQQIVAHMSSETVINIILDCEQLLSILAPCRWATTVENIIREIFDSCINYMSEHFANLIASDSFLSLGHRQGNSWTLSHIENILLRTASTLTPDQACKSYPRANRLNKLLQAKVITMPLSSNDDTDEMKINNLNTRQEEVLDWSEEFTRLVSAILSAVEQCLIRQCARAMRVASWQRMDAELRNKIQKLACLTEAVQNLETEKLSSRNGISKNNYATSSLPQSRQNDLQQVRLTILQQQNGKFNQTSMSSNKQTNHGISKQTNSSAVHYNNFDIRNSSVSRPLSKTTSKANVPTSLAVMNAKNNSLKVTTTKTHPKEDKCHDKANFVDKVNGSSKSSQVRIKSRYLDPPLWNAKTQYSSNKVTALAGTDPKPCPAMDLRKKNQAKNKPVVEKMRAVTLLETKESSNLSLDSLSSTTNNHEKKKMNLMKIAPRMPSNDKLDISVDSLSISVKSSSKCSQESLLQNNGERRRHSNTSSATSTKAKNKENLEKLIKPTKASAEREKLNKMNLMLVRNRNRTASNVVTTSDSSPSSIIISTRSSTGGQTTRRNFSNLGVEKVKKSFLSQKSREILAKREQKLQEAAIEPATTTLLKKTNRSFAATHIPKSKILTQSGLLKKTKETKILTKDDKQTKLNDEKDILGSSKLERSSTFCKECPDNPDLLEISDG